MKAVILDIEGTTTDINFVHKVLFPYSREHMEAFLSENQQTPSIKIIIDSIKKEFLEDTSSLEEVLGLIKNWIDTDQKIPQLKQLQGILWEEGYKKNIYQGHIYADVVPCIENWRKQGMKIFIYSSGSVKAQKLLFQHTTEGDITDLFDGYYDTGVGHKKEVQSYKNIIEDIDIPGSEVIFLSDIEDELNAAEQAGLNTYHVNRDGLYSDSKHPIIDNFREAQIESTNSL